MFGVLLLGGALLVYRRRRATSAEQEPNDQNDIPENKTNAIV